MTTPTSDLSTTSPITALPDSGHVNVNGGIHSVVTNATAQGLHAGNTITPTKSFTFTWRGTHYNFRAGITAVTEPDLKAALTAASCPFNTP